MAIEYRRICTPAPAAAASTTTRYHDEGQDHAEHPLEPTAPLITAVPRSTSESSSPASTAPVAFLTHASHRLRMVGRKAALASAAVIIAAHASLPRIGDPITSARVALPEPCLQRRPQPGAGPGAHLANYESVPGTLELFRENSVVCPDQTPYSLRAGVLASAPPDQWEEYRRARHLSAGGGSGDRANGGGGGRGLIVFKRGGSGSTWFDTLLGNHPDIDFRHEAHHSVYKPFHGVGKSTRKMREFLKGESICTSPGKMCGFSISPSKHAVGVDWEELISDTGATLAVFVRTNVLKRVLGLIRKRNISKLPKWCRQGSSYKVNMDSDPNCTLSESTYLPPEKLKSMEEACFVQSWDILEVALRAGAPFQIVTYEGMQQNLTRTFERLGSFTGWPLSSFDWSSHVKTAKVTSEDLRRTVSNYEEVEGALADKSCFLDMLHSESKELFPLCYAPRPNVSGVDIDSDNE